MKKVLFFTIIIGLFFTASAFGQANNKKQAKETSRTIKPQVKSINRNMDDISDGNYRKRRRSAKLTDNEYLDFGIEYKARKTKPKVRNFVSSTQPHADGLRKKRKSKPKSGINNSRKRKPKTQSLLPFVEQDNIYRKRKS